jgi:uncharacterized protein YukE
MNDIVNCTDKYAVELRNTYDEITILNDKIKTLNPENIRKKFDIYWNIVNSKSEETNDALEEIDESINNLEDINRTNNIGGRKSRKSRKRGKGRKGRKSSKRGNSKKY